jgi:tRNA(fMet)-specific endonuclease VapC
LRSYLLDTNICIYYLKGLYDLQNKVSQVGVSRCYLSEITVAELRFGAEKSEQ